MTNSIEKKKEKSLKVLSTDNRKTPKKLRCSQPLCYIDSKKQNPVKKQRKCKKKEDERGRDMYLRRGWRDDMQEKERRALWFLNCACVEEEEEE
ncbi:hypothetical protein LguiB_000833 [Lonicera macranthoides]